MAVRNVTIPMALRNVTILMAVRNITIPMALRNVTIPMTLRNIRLTQTTDDKWSDKIDNVVTDPHIGVSVLATFGDQFVKVAMEFTKDLLSCYKNLITSGADIYSDISVEVEVESFPCHRYVLAACSPFFRTLFRWDKQEVKRNSFHLEDISSETFKLIYGFIYLHDNALNEDNFLDVWKAADFLQIDFIVSACEKLAMETINEKNHRYFWHAKLIGKNVMAKILEYITFNFDQFKDSQCLMELEGVELLNIVRDSNLMELEGVELLNMVRDSNLMELEGVELLNMVRDSNLKTNREEYVVDAILKWVSHSCKDNGLPGTMFSVYKVIPATSSQSESVTVKSEIDNLRAEYLVPLLTVSRLDSLSHDYVNYIFSHKLIVRNVKVRDAFMKVWLYRFDSMSNYWPTFACHRRFSQWADVILMPTVKKTVEIFNINEREMTGILETCALPRDSFFNKHKEKAYLCGYTDSNRDSLSMFLEVKNTWQNVASLHLGDNMNQPPGEFKAGRQTLFSFSIGDRVFVAHTRSRGIFTWDPINCTHLRKLTSVPSATPIIHATLFKSFVIAITGDPYNQVMLNIYDTTKQEWESTVLPVNISDQNILSFRKEDELYLMTSHGKLFVVDNVGSGVSVKHVTTFSNFNCSLIGALV
ncbi:hypothetical protein Btru_054960 [Bulinus truncatus]|nr:hypothetical protein Btru_054960 [Bulinus truncatus]